MTMNVLPGTIIGIATEEGISIVKVGLEKMVFTSIVLDTPADSPYLVKDRPVSLLFKETEVIIAKAMPLAISVRNRIECTIRKIRPGKLLCELTLGFAGMETGTAYSIRSIITREACEQLELKEDDKVIALIKTNEVSLSV
jgi:molybdate transport system regulatory protein